MMRRTGILKIYIFLVVILTLAEGFAAPQSFAAAKLTGPLKGKSFKVSYIKNGSGSKIEYGRASGLKKKGYRIFQGACTDGEYAYLVLFNKKKDKCRIIKLDPETNKVIRKSPAYKMYHGNDAAYDSKRNRIAVVHGDGDTKRISVFDPKTLKRTKVVKLKFKKAFRGASAKTARKIKGVTGIAYDRKEDQFVCSVKSTFHYVVLDRKFRPVKYVRTKTRGSKLQKQGMDIYGRYILRVMNVYKGKRIISYIYIYKMSGKYVKRIRIRTKEEAEAVYILNDRLYIPAYNEKGSGKKFRNWSYLLRSQKKI